MNTRHSRVLLHVASLIVFGLLLLPACGVIPGYERHAIPTPTPVILPYNEAIATAEAGSDVTEQVTAYYERGNIHFALGSYTEAITDYTRVIAMDPTHARAYNNRALVYDTIGQVDQALADYTEATIVDPEYLRAYQNRLNLHERQGNHAGMADDYAHLARLDEENRDRYLYRRANLLYGMDDMEGARQAYDATLDANPRHVDALYERARMKLTDGDAESAIIDLTNAIRLSPNASNVYYTRALAYSAIDNHITAIQDFTQVLALQPDDPRALLGRASAYYAAGDHAAARTDLERIPEGALEDEALQRAVVFLRDKLME